MHLQPSVPGVTVAGRGVAPGEMLHLGDGAAINTPAGRIEFVYIGRSYAGVLISDSDMRLGVMSGQTAELGREPNHPGLAYPDRRGQDNIQWCSGTRAARARAGGFTLDRALAGRRQAAIQMFGDSIQVAPLHDRCPTYILRGRNLLRAESTVQAALGDMVVAGTTVVALREPE